MNLRLGLFRLWVFMTAIWLVVSIPVAIAAWSNDAPARSSAAQWATHDAQCSIPNTNRPWCDYAPTESRLKPIQGWIFPLFVVLPPGILFVLGLGVLWVAQGFKVAPKRMLFEELS